MFPHQEIGTGNYGSYKKTSFIYKVKKEKNQIQKCTEKVKTENELNKQEQVNLRFIKYSFMSLQEFEADCIKIFLIFEVPWVSRKI